MLSNKNFFSLNKEIPVTNLAILDVLEDFYINGGGKDVIPPHKAMKRLSREGYRAGRCALREGQAEQACRYLSQSFRRHPNVKSLIHWTRAALIKKLALKKGVSLP